MASTDNNKSTSQTSSDYNNMSAQRKRVQDKQSSLDKSLRFFNNIFFGEYKVKKQDGYVEEEFNLQVNIDYTSSSNTQEIVNTYSDNHKLMMLRNKFDSQDYTISSVDSNNNTINTNVEVLESSNVNSFASLIEWSKKYKSIAIGPRDIALLKNFQSYPINRLMILRRFSGGSKHNLYEIKAAPEQKLVGFYSLLDNPISMSFNEKWKTFDETFFNVIQDLIGIELDTIPGIGQLVDTGKSSPFAQDFLWYLGQELGLLTTSSPYGKANMIYEAATRDVSGEDIKSGLETNFKFKFETTYTYIELPDMSGKDLLLNIIHKATKMGTNDAIFLVSDAGRKKADALFNSFKNAEGASTLINAFISAVTKLGSQVKDVVMSIFNSQPKEGESFEPSDDQPFGPISTVLKGLDSAIGTMMQVRHARYEWRIKGLIGALSGEPTAPWHITLGNPKSPWFSMGNLVLESLTIEPAGELMYDDFPSEWKITADLKNGRAMGSSEIFKCFNPGKAREYVVPSSMSKIINITVPEGSTVKLPGDITIPYKQDNVKETEKVEKNEVENSPESIDPLNKINNNDTMNTTGTNQTISNFSATNSTNPSNVNK